MIELNDFFNTGTGWTCRHCDRELKAAAHTPANHSRVFKEGEAESKIPTLTQSALAKWTDETHRFLTCPRCGITEPVEKA